VKDDHVMKLVGLIQGYPTPFDEKYLVSYDPDRRGVDPDGNEMLALIKVTDDLDQAMGFVDAAQAMALWKQSSTRWPTRPDGQPNRPLTAFTVEVAKRSKFRERENAAHKYAVGQKVPSFEGKWIGTIEEQIGPLERAGTTDPRYRVSWVKKSNGIRDETVPKESALDKWIAAHGFPEGSEPSTDEFEGD
jgi:hypothetical protein